MYKLRLNAVDSRHATPDELEQAGITPEQIPRTKEGILWNIAAHQAATVKALRFGNAPIIVNQAMTGDGKTLAGRFQLFSEKWRSFAMYPTNELAHDQVQSYDELMRDWTPPAWKRPPHKRLINAQEIDEFSFGDSDATRLEKIRGMLRHEYILTNPDIFHLIMNFAYQQQGVASDILPAYLAEGFPLYIFDEFHLFGVEQTASVMIAMLLLKHLAGQATNPPRFLFLSATPQKLLSDLAGHVGLAVEQIQGNYEYGHSETAAGYRRILQAADLHLYAGRLEEWVREHFEDTITLFFLNHLPAAKGLIIANSVATAHRIYEFLHSVCGDEIRLGINTGITPKEDRNRDFDLLVATSTVDVGVDFKINFLLFESRDAASHQQRLGRLGRHKSTDGYEFQAFEAHALLPQWTLDGLAKQFPEGEAISREEYKVVLEENFSPLQQFDSYIKRWAGVQAAKVLHELSDKYIRTQYRALSRILETEYRALFGTSVKKYFALINEKQGATIAAASSFRGGSVLTALIQDPETNSQRIMSYNLVSLLLNADLQAVPIEEMLEMAQRQRQDPHILEKTKPLAAYRLLGWLDKPRQIEVELDTELPLEQREMVIEQNRFRIYCLNMSELQALNKRLYERVLVAFFIPDKDPDLVRRLLRLGFQIELFPFTARGNVQGTVVFGRDALLIDSVLIRRRNDNAFIW